MSNTDFEYLWKRRDDVLYKARLSSLYHGKRERFLDLSDKLGKAVAVIGSSAALWKIADPNVLAWVLVPVAAWSALSLVFSLSDRAKRHAELGRQWREMIADIESKGEREFTETDVNEWTAAAAKLEASEPPTLGTLVALCQNQIALADGHPESVHPVGWIPKVFMHIFDLPPRPASRPAP